jgi:hypothetical protein
VPSQSAQRGFSLLPRYLANRTVEDGFEDDGITLPGASTGVTIALIWTASRVRVEVGVSGTYPLTCSEMRVILPEDESWAVELSGADGIALRL